MSVDHPQRARELLRAAAPRRVRAPTLLESKLRVPTLGPGTVPRTRLHALLERSPGVRVTLVVAPAGFGKTTLLSSWLHGEPRWSQPHAWVALDEGDADAARLMAHVRAALCRAVPAVGAALGRPAPRASPGATASALANELERAGTEVVLVLDDCHLVTSSASRRALQFLVERLPRCVHVIASTRTAEALRLGRLRASGALREIRAADLRFDVEGARLILASGPGASLERADVERLLELTEGWPAALWLAGLSLRAHPDPAAFLRDFAGDHRHIRDYMLDEVLQTATPDDRRFLVRTSILERLSGPLCDAVLGGSGAGGQLASIERRNQLLVALDERDGWYRYHHLFAGFLRAQLRATEPHLAPELHRRAAAWYRFAGEIDDAIRHAAAAGDYTEAGEMIVARGAIADGRERVGSIGAALALIPPSSIAGDPQLAACAAWHARLAGAPEPSFMELLERAGQPDADRAWVGVARTQQAELALLRMLGPYGDAAGMVRGARAAVLEVPPEDPAASMALLHLALALMQDGRYADARGPAEAALDRAADLTLLERVTALAFLAAVDAHGGAAAAASHGVEQALELIDAHELSSAAAIGFAATALADALVTLGEPWRARPFAEAGAGLLAMPAPHVTHAHALLVFARCQAALGDHRGARAQLAKARRAVAGAPDARAVVTRADELERSLAADPLLAVSLTRRELEVLRLLDGELTRREIGAALFVSPNTVKTHVRSIMGKIGAASRGEAVERARSLGLLAGPAESGAAADAEPPARTSPG